LRDLGDRQGDINPPSYQGRHEDHEDRVVRTGFNERPQRPRPENLERIGRTAERTAREQAEAELQAARAGFRHG